MCTNKHSQLFDCWPLVMCVLLKLHLSIIMYFKELDSTCTKKIIQINPLWSTHFYSFLSYYHQSLVHQKNQNLNLHHLASSYKSSPSSHNDVNLDNILSWSWFLKCWKFMQIQSQNIHRKKQGSPNFGNLEINIWRFLNKFSLSFYFATSVPNNKKMEIDSYARQPLLSWPLIKNLKALKKSGINTILSWYFTKAFNLLDLNIWRNLQIYDWYYN